MKMVELKITIPKHDMRSLENRAKSSKRDMDILAALEEMRSKNSRHARVTVDQMLEILKHSTHEGDEKTIAELDEEDEKLIKSIAFTNSKPYVKRIEDDEDDGYLVIPGRSSRTSKIKDFSKSVVNAMDGLTKPNGPESTNKEGSKSWTLKVPEFVVKSKAATTNPHKKRKTASEDSRRAPAVEENSETAEKINVLQSLRQNYDSDESDD